MTLPLRDASTTDILGNATQLLLELPQPMIAAGNNVPFILFGQVLSDIMVHNTFKEFVKTLTCANVFGRLDF